MKPNVYIYIAVMALVTYGIRMLPLALIRKEIKNKMVRSFLYYVPFVTLAVMTFPAILSSTAHLESAAAGFAAALFLAYKGGSLFRVSLSACAVVFALELFL